MKLNYRRFKEQQLKLIGNLKSCEIKKKGNIIKSLLNSKSINDPAEGITLDNWKQYFEKLGNSDEDENKNFPQLLQIQKNIDRLDSEQLTNMRVQVNKPFSIQELKQMSKDKLSSGKAVGFDRIRNEVLKIILNNELFSNMILELFNKILDKGTYPKLWKTDLIKPVHKKGSKGDYVIGELIYMFPSDMNLRIGKIKNYNNKILVSSSSFNIGTNIKINLDDNKHLDKDKLDVKPNKPDIKSIKNTNKISK